MIADLFFITLIIVFIIDISGIVEELETRLSKWLNGKVRIHKPWRCSLCMTWWVGLIYLICMGKFTLIWIAAISLFAHLSGVLATLLIWIREMLSYIIEKGYNALK